MGRTPQLSDRPASSDAAGPSLAERTLLCMTASALSLAVVAYCGALHAVALFPAGGAQHVCTDTPLALTFDRPPQLGIAGVIRVLRADGSLADSIDLADPNSGRKPIGGALSDNGTLHLFNYDPVILDRNTASLHLHPPLDYCHPYAAS